MAALTIRSLLLATSPKTELSQPWGPRDSTPKTRPLLSSAGPPESPWQVGAFVPNSVLLTRAVQPLLTQTTLFPSMRIRVPLVLPPACVRP